MPRAQPSQNRRLAIRQSPAVPSQPQGPAMRLEPRVAVRTKRAVRSSSCSNPRCAPRYAESTACCCSTASLLPAWTSPSSQTHRPRRRLQSPPPELLWQNASPNKLEGYRPVVKPHTRTGSSRSVARDLLFPLPARAAPRVPHPFRGLCGRVGLRLAFHAALGLSTDSERGSRSFVATVPSGCLTADLPGTASRPARLLQNLPKSTIPCIVLLELRY